MSMCCSAAVETCFKRDNNQDTSKVDLEKEFAESTSCHGLTYWFDYINVYQRIAWMILVFGSFCGLTYQVFLRIDNYYLYEASSNSNGQFLTQIQFPAVTICNYNRYFADSPEDVDKFDLLNRITSHSFLEISSHYPNISEVSVSAAELDAIPDFTISEYLNIKGYQLVDNHTLLNCMFQSKICSASDFTPVLTRLGKCYTFNANSSSPREQTVAGYGHGFSVVMDILYDWYTEEALIGHQEAGIMFQVHPPFETPNVERFGVAVPAGHKGFASLTRTDYQIMYEPWGKCNPKAQKKLKYFRVYTLNSCMQECYTDHMIARCRCHRFDQYWAADVAPECTVQQVKNCATPATNDLENTLTPESCQCFSPCNFIEYSSIPSYASFPGPVTKKYFEFLKDLNVTATVIQDSFVSLEVTFREIGYTSITQSKKVDESGLLSDIGGQLGVWVGMSFLTVVEIFQYIVMKIHAVTTDRKKAKKETERENSPLRRGGTNGADNHEKNAANDTPL